jgi:hypothetical protein
VIVYVKLTLGDGGKKDAADGVKSIGLSFVQIISLLTTFPIAWPRIFTSLFQIGGAVTVLGQHMVNLKCMFPEESEAEVFYSSQLAWGLFPPFLVGACIATWLVVDCGCNKGYNRGPTGAGDTTIDRPIPHPPSLPASTEVQQNPPAKQPLMLRQKIYASVVALLYLIWPGLCSETFALFACRSLCGDTDRLRLRVDLTEICFEGRHANFVSFLGAPMLLLFVIGLPTSALVMVGRMRRRAKLTNRRVQDCKGHSTWGLFYSAFRDDMWFWEGTVALRKIGIAMIGVFGAALKEMQVLLTLVLVFFVILVTAVARPYGESKNGKLLQKLEVSALCLLFLTLWTASVFSLYPRCEGSDGKSLWWCEVTSVIIGLSDVALVVGVGLIFIRLKGAGKCLDCCSGKLVSVSRWLTWEWDMRHGGEAAVQARIRSRTVDAAGDGRRGMYVNPLAGAARSESGGLERDSLEGVSGGEAKTTTSKSKGKAGLAVPASAGGSGGGGGGGEAKTRRSTDKSKYNTTAGADIEMVAVNVRHKAKRNSYERRVQVIKNLNANRREAGVNPLFGEPRPREEESRDER